METTSDVAKEMIRKLTAENYQLRGLLRTVLETCCGPGCSHEGDRDSLPGDAHERFWEASDSARVLLGMQRR